MPDYRLDFGDRFRILWITVTVCGWIFLSDGITAVEGIANNNATSDEWKTYILAITGLFNIICIICVIFIFLWMCPGKMGIILMISAFFAMILRGVVVVVPDSGNVQKQNFLDVGIMHIAIFLLQLYIVYEGWHVNRVETRQMRSEVNSI
mmetsp:Transcript_39086/g.48447  ORF Transcript_39086/g.48447 Transcript_39086/m.48447 type:complete len:150 (-) Transcript_39086:24-473(-)